MDYLFWAIFKMAAMKIGVYIYVFRGEEFNYANKKSFCLEENLYKQLFKCIFRAFLVIFCASPWATEGYCAPSTHERLRPSFCCSLDLPQYQKSMPSNKSRMDYLF